MSKCVICNKEVDEHDDFCYGCGNYVCVDHIIEHEKKYHLSTHNHHWQFASWWEESACFVCECGAKKWVDTFELKEEAVSQ